MKILFDTCIIIDALQNREPFAKNAQQLFLYVANCKLNGFITAKSTTDIYYLMHRCTHSDTATRSFLKRIFCLFELLDTAGTDCKYAVSSEVSDYEDAVMIETALRTGMDGIVTRNVKDYSKSSVNVYTPEELIEKLTKIAEE